MNSIDAYDMLNNFEHRFKINTCYSNINQQSSQNIQQQVKPSYNPFAIGSRWLAFADSRVSSVEKRMGIYHNYSLN